MTLEQYIDAKRMKAKDAAHDLRIDRRYLGQLLKGQYRPSFDLAEKIAVWSEGHVMPNDWMRVEVPKPRKRIRAEASGVPA